MAYKLGISSAGGATLIGNWSFGESCLARLHSWKDVSRRVLTEQPSANRRYRRNWSRSAGCLHKPRALNVLLALRDSTKPKLSDASPTLRQI